MYIKRLLEKSLKDAIKTFPVTLITGPRQSGKTTLVQKVLSGKYQYVSLGGCPKIAFLQILVL